MKTVKAARIHNYGEAEAVRVEDAPLPAPQSGELLIRIHAAGVNPIDWKIRAGYLRQTMPLPLPFILGGDFSGVVEAVGAGVTDFRVGDEVYGQAGVFNRGSGAFAESAIARAGSVAAKPRGLTHAEAAALPTAGISALQALTRHLRVSAGQKVLIHDGAGGVGSVAIQLAKHFGARVATTLSAEDIAYVQGLGADEVIDYDSPQFEEVLGGLDGVLDAVGCDTYVRSFRVLKKGVRPVAVLEPPRQELRNDFGVEALALSTQVTSEGLARLAELVDQGALRVQVDKAFPLEQAGAALHYLEKASPKGKVVLKVAQPDTIQVSTPFRRGGDADADRGCESVRSNDWAVLLAGGDGNRLRSLTHRIEGDARPKQFCRLFGGRSLLGHTRERLRPIFREDRTLFVMTKAHEAFYREELADAGAARVVAQPANRGTGVAIIVALLRVLRHDPDAVVAFFPTDHYFADDAAFAAAVQSAACAARKRPESLILLGAKPQWAEVEYGWIEPGAPIPNRRRTRLFKVCRFWEKPPLAKARELMSAGGLWNTFVTAGHVRAFWDLLNATVPAAVAGITDALAQDDLDAAYRNVDAIDFSKDVLSLEPHRLLVIPDAASGWADLGTPERLIDTLVRNRIEPGWLPGWLGETRGADIPAIRDSSPTFARPLAEQVRQ